MQMDSEFKIGYELLKKFKEQIESLSNAQNEMELLEIIEAVKEPIRNAAYRIKNGNGPLKEELFDALAVIVREIREFNNPEELKEAAKKVVEIINNLEAQVSA
ncbi:MAG: hypothetical protein DSY42_00715 [Aquifex sp.]|nr:MAG: hypothetical protein DSY42_00715 [Aquifex sp.]